MKLYNPAVLYCAGSTGLEIARLLLDKGLVPHPCQPIVCIESREQAPPEVPNGASYVTLSARLDEMAPYREHAERIPAHVRALDTAFWQDTALGGGQEPGVMAVAVAYHADHLENVRRRALLQAENLPIETINALGDHDNE